MSNTTRNVIIGVVAVLLLLAVWSLASCGTNDAEVERLDSVESVKGDSLTLEADTLSTPVDSL